MLNTFFRDHRSTSVKMYVFIAVAMSLLFVLPAEAELVDDWNCAAETVGNKSVLFGKSYESGDGISTGSDPYNIEKKYCVHNIEKDKQHISFTGLAGGGIVFPQDADSDTDVQFFCGGEWKEVDELGDPDANDISYALFEKSKPPETVGISDLVWIHPVFLFVGENCVEDQTAGVPIRYRIEENQIVGDNKPAYIYYLQEFEGPPPAPVEAPPGTCSCSKTSVDEATSSEDEESMSAQKDIIPGITTQLECGNGNLFTDDTGEKWLLDECDFAVDTPAEDETKPTTTTENTDSNLQTPTTANYTVDTSDYKKPVGYKGPLPDCAFDGSCRNVNDLLRVAIKGGEIVLGFVGTLALAFFIYGGITMILSMGSAERVKKGKDVLVAAVIGLIITFSAYALVNFVLDALQISSEFRIINSL